MKKTDVYLTEKEWVAVLVTHAINPELRYVVTDEDGVTTVYE